MLGHAEDRRGRREGLVHEGLAPGRSFQSTEAIVQRKDTVMDGL